MITYKDHMWCFRFGKFGLVIWYGNKYPWTPWWFIGNRGHGSFTCWRLKLIW